MDRGALDLGLSSSQYLDGRNVVAGVKAALDGLAGEGAARGGVDHVQEVGDLDALSVVDEEFSGGVSLVGRKCDDQSEVVLLDVDGGQGTARGHGEDLSSPQVGVGLLELGRQVDDLSGALEALESEQIVPLAGGEVGVDVPGLVLKDGGDQDGVAQHELLVDPVGGLVLGEDAPQVVGNGLAVDVGLPHEGVHEGEDLVPHSQGAPGGLGDRIPPVELLRGGSKGVVVAREGVEGSDLDPSVRRSIGFVLDDNCC